MTDPYTGLDKALDHVSALVDAAIAREKADSDLIDPDLKEASFAYLERGGKRIRPLVTHLAAGAVGGDPAVVLEAALAVEVFHTWTLVHDDLIDNDELRRGGETIHVAFRNRILSARPDLAAPAASYGTAIAILAGDYLQGVAMRLMLDSALRGEVSNETAHSAARSMQTVVLKDLVEGEVADVAFTQRGIDEVSESDLIEMYRQKSASLIAFAARSGAMLALDEPDPDAALPAAMARFAERAGVAFQIQDDVLGIVGDEVKLGKPIGSDIREGKRTLVLHRAFDRSGPDDRRVLEDVVGRASARAADIARVRAIIESTGSLEEVAARADDFIGEALGELAAIPASRFRDRLAEWARRLVRRDR